MITRWRVDCQRPTNTLLLLVSTWAATGILLGGVAGRYAPDVGQARNYRGSRHQFRYPGAH